MSSNVFLFLIVRNCLQWSFLCLCLCWNKSESAFRLHVFIFIVDTSDLLPLLVHNHCAFGSGVEHHCSKRCHRWLCEHVFHTQAHKDCVQYLKQGPYAFVSRSFATRATVRWTTVSLRSSFEARKSSQLSRHVLPLLLIHNVSVFIYKVPQVPIWFVFADCRMKSGWM